MLATLIEYFGNYKLDKIPQGSVHTYANTRRSLNEATTVNNELRVLSRVLNVARDECGYPSSRLKLTKLWETGQGKAIAWNDQELKALFESAAKVDAELLPLLTFIANTGCRNGEALALEWSQVDLERGYIRLWPSKSWQTKNSKPREVPIGNALMPWLEGPRLDPRWVFPSRNGSRFVYWPNRRWQAVVDAAGLSGGVHQLRHTYASHFLMKKPDLGLLAEVLGHSDVRTTAIYKHLLPDHLATARGVVNFEMPVDPETVDEHRRKRTENKVPRTWALGKTVPKTVPNADTTIVTIERDKGFEPSTCSLGSCRSTTELIPHSLESLRDPRAGRQRRCIRHVARLTELREKGSLGSDRSQDTHEYREILRADLHRPFAFDATDDVTQERSNLPPALGQRHRAVARCALEIAEFGELAEDVIHRLLGDANSLGQVCGSFAFRRWKPKHAQVRRIEIAVARGSELDEDALVHTIPGKAQQRADQGLSRIRIVGQATAEFDCP